MSDIRIIYETPILLAVTIDNLLANNGKSFSDITDACYLLKNKAGDLDTEALFSQDFKTTNGVALNSGDSTIDVTFEKADFSSVLLDAGKGYLICLGVEFNDSGDYIENKNTNYLHVEFDKLRK